MTNIIEIKGLSKSYLNKKALNNLDLNIEKGKVVGILGPNGSGKTTLIKIITGILRQSKGEILIDGSKPGVYTKSIVSYLPDRNFLYKWMTVEDSIKFYKDFYKDFDESKAYELLKFMKLDRKAKVESLSKGMNEKLNLTLVLSRNAKIYILDEPIAGVDPVARDQILDAIIKNYNRESTMIITTHLVRDMENIFDDVVFLREGVVELSGNAEELREERSMQIDDLYKEIFG
ncbi:ABC transporter ATP-binding protein [Wansuia hejianensis]|uniref:ABC transporter ATP-binding protein n=1 Tax=Wansuia hejianensis TaxID=2763667 RepID=A0A926F0R8_9FIRM|nr:ABC transporter ATP-binding protein [Wansuia hejianensis]MBC8589779.1 ABC transporter ATP-binding protein [Wansuia hejianensis]